MLEEQESVSTNSEHAETYTQRIGQKIAQLKSRAIKEIEESPDKPTDKKDFEVLIMEKVAAHFLSENGAGFLGADKKWFFSHANPETKEYILECYTPGVIAKSIIKLAKEQQEDDLTQKGLTTDERRKIESAEYQFIKILEIIEKIIFNDLKNYHQGSQTDAEKIIIMEVLSHYEEIENFLDIPDSEDISETLRQKIEEFKNKIELIKKELTI